MCQYMSLWLPLCHSMSMCVTVYVLMCVYDVFQYVADSLSYIIMFGNLLTLAVVLVDTSLPVCRGRHSGGPVDHP